MKGEDVVKHFDKMITDNAWAFPDKSIIETMRKNLKEHIDADAVFPEGIELPEMPTREELEKMAKEAETPKK